MATDLKAKPQPAKHELFVEQQIERVSRRIHAIEVGKALLTWLVVTLGYALVSALFDLAVGKEAGTWAGAVRIGGLAIYLLATLWLGIVAIVRFLRRINPYYAARQIEETIPDAKNSVVNWLDLRQSKLPPIIRNALGLRAARDLKGTDPEKAVDARATWMLAGALGILVVGMAILFLTGPNRFGSLMRRAFLPMGDFALAGRTEITLLQPETGNVAVTLQQKIDFRARISGAVPRVNTPQAPRLWYRYNPADPWAPTPLHEDNDGTWLASMSPDQILNGFWYKLTAGDAETEEYQVTVRGTPQAERFQVIYHPRAYLRVPEFSFDYPNERDLFPRIKTVAGTEVTLVVRANRPLLQARVEIEQGGAKQADLIGAIDTDDAQSFRVKFRPEKSGRFRVFFVARGGEQNTDRSSYPIDVWTDSTPNVVLLKPAEDVSLPANGTLQLEGLATDDFGINELSLQVTLLEGTVQKPLAAKVYRPGKNLQFADGSFPDHLDYKDFLALDTIKNLKGQPVTLAADMFLEYYLQARDNSDYPEKLGNLGKSKTYKIKIAPPQDPKKAEQERNQAEREQKKNEQKQDQDLAKEEKERQDKNADGSAKTPQQKDVDNTAKKIQDAIDKKEQQERGEAKGEPEKEQKSGSKEGPDAQPNTAKDENKPAPADKQPGQKKDGGQDGPMNQQQAGNSKDGGEKNQAEPKGSEKKDEHGSAKDQGKTGTKESAGAAKDQGQNEKPSAEQKPSSAKENAPGQGEQSAQAKEQKPGADGSSPTPQAKDDKQGKEQTQAKKDGAQGGEKSGARGEDAAPEKAANKPADPQNDKKQPNEAAGARSRDTKSAPPNAAKQTDPAQAQKAGASREASSGEQTAGGASEDTKRFNDKLQKAAEKGDAEGMKQTLEDAARDAKDPAVREAAKKALKEMQNPSRDAEAARKAEIGLKEMQKNSKDPAAREAADKALKELEKLAKDPEARKKAEEALKDIQRNTKDPGVAKAADEALKNMERQPQEPDARKTAEDALKELQRQAKDPDASKTAEEALKEMERLAKDPEARKKAEQALKEMQKLTKDPETSKAAGDVLKEMEKLMNDPEKRKAAEDALKELEKLAKESGETKDPSPKNADPAKKGDSPGKGQDPSAKTGPNAKGPRDTAGPSDVNRDFSKRGGDLNLEDLKKKVTPDILKKAGLDEKDWQQFLKDAKAYQETLSKQRQTDPLNLRGDPSQWQNVGPRRVEANNPSVSPAQSGRALPPPEFREKYFRWTTRPDGK